jgi:hypothetical protein
VDEFEEGGADAAAGVGGGPPGGVLGVPGDGEVRVEDEDGVGGDADDGGELALACGGLAGDAADVEVGEDEARGEGPGGGEGEEGGVERERPAAAARPAAPPITV